MGKADGKIKIPPVYRKNLMITSALCHQYRTRAKSDSTSGVEASAGQNLVKSGQSLDSNTMQHGLKISPRVQAGFLFKANGISLRRCQDLFGKMSGLVWKDIKTFFSTAN
jgi:hypothetical protein